MVLIGKIVNTETSCLLFKMKPIEGDTNIDTLNVFVACPLHLLKENDYKLIIQVAGNQHVRIQTPIFVSANMLTVQHTFLDIAVGVIQNPEVINNNPELLEISYILNDGSIDASNLINASVDILYCNQSGDVNNIPTKITNINYELGSYEQNDILTRMPLPGGFIILEEDAKTGISGSVVVYDNHIVGMIVLSSNTSKGSSNTLARTKALATDTYYFMPHIQQCVDAIHQFTDNNPENLEELSKLTVLKTLENSVLPVVNHLGATFIFKQGSSMTNRTRYLSIIDIHNFLNFPFFLTEQDSGLSIPIKTALNTNEDFINFFYSKQQNSEVIIVAANYMDKVSKERIDIIFDDSNYANILDWSFRGEPKASLKLTFKTKTTNDDGSIDISNEIYFTFNSSETIDDILGKHYPRTTMEIPSIAFNRGMAVSIINSKYQTGADLNFLCKKCDNK